MTNIAADSLLKKIARRSEEIKALSLLWDVSLGEETRPKPEQFLIWLNRYGFDSVEYGINCTLEKQSIERHHGNEMSQEYMIRYATAAMKRFSNGEASDAH